MPIVSGPQRTSSGVARLRRPTLVSAPLSVIGLMGGSFAVALVLWGAWHPHDLGPAFWIPFSVSATVAVMAFTGQRGCFVDISDDDITDVVAWVRIQRIRRSEVVSIRVRGGFWRLYELTTVEGTTRLLLGASPAQFPSRLLADGRRQDQADIELMLD